MKYKFVKKVKGKVQYYNQKVATGDEVEFNEHFSRKAERNPDFEIVKEGEPEA